MGYKVINKNAIVAKKDNTTTDTIFYFLELDEAKEYLKAVNEFTEFNKKSDTSSTLPNEHILEPMTKEEEKKFSFRIPAPYQIPHKTITRPLSINDNEPYWVTTKELLLPQK